MDAAGWIEIVQLIPPEYHTSLSVVMQNGMEISLQTVLRLEERYAVCRGRPMGSTDGGMTFFLPYDQINCLYYNKVLKEEEVLSWFPEQPAEGEALAETIEDPAAAEPLQPAAPVRRPSVLPPKPAPAAPAPAAGSSTSMITGMALPAKAAMIERLRKRAQNAGAGGPAAGSAQGTAPKPKPGGGSSPGTKPKPPEQK